MSDSAAVRLATVHLPGDATPQPALLRVDDTVVPLGAAYPRGMVELIERWAGADALPTVGVAHVPLSSATLCAPVQAANIICVGKNYADHVKEARCCAGGTG